MWPCVGGGFSKHCPSDTASDNVLLWPLYVWLCVKTNESKKLRFHVRKCAIYLTFWLSNDNLEDFLINRLPATVMESLLSDFYFSIYTADSLLYVVDEWLGINIAVLSLFPLANSIDRQQKKTKYSAKSFLWLPSGYFNSQQYFAVYNNDRVSSRMSKYNK